MVKRPLLSKKELLLYPYPFKTSRIQVSLLSQRVWMVSPTRLLTSLSTFLMTNQLCGLNHALLTIRLSRVRIPHLTYYSVLMKFLQVPTSQAHTAVYTLTGITRPEKFSKQKCVSLLHVKSCQFMMLNRCTRTP